jgi:hypothetical protein
VTLFKLKSNRDPVTVSGQAFGVAVALEADDSSQLERLTEWLPPCWRIGEAGADELRFKLTKIGHDAYQLLRDGAEIGGGTLEETVRGYEWMLRTHIAKTAPEHLFVHAGTVAHGGRAIVIPGLSFSGKTTLVTALVQAGAVYYSDEYAVFDKAGLVHPYPKPLAIRSPDARHGSEHHHPEQLGATVGDDPIPIGLVVCSQYRSGAEWEPVELTPAEAMLELMVHAFKGGEQAEGSMSMLGKAVVGVSGLKGDRGDAAALAPELLARIERPAVQP